MAIIFDRVPASGHKCLVLEPKESLVYPFDFGDWEEIRIGVALSLANVSGFDQPLQDESIVGIYKEDYAKNFYLGIKSNNEFYPNKDSCSYIGIGPRISSLGESINLYASIGYYTNYIGYFNAGVSASIIPSGATGYNFDFSYNNLSTITMPSPFTLTGELKLLDTYFCNAFGIKIKIKDKGTSNQNFSITMFNNNDQQDDLLQFPSLQNMKVALGRMIGSSNELTGFFTSTYNNSGVPAPIPDAFYISNPFNLNRLMIHNILIEKYA
jgi:hypothetical protein